MAITVLNAPPQPADISAAALGWIDAKVDHGAVGDGVTNDTAAIQAAIDACEDGGTVYLPTGDYKTTAALVIDKPMTFQGAGCHELFGSMAVDGLSCTVPIQEPFIAGAVLVPSTAGQNGLNVTVAGVAVHLRDFGIRFADALRWTNTGHGVFMRAPLIDTGYDSGVYGGSLERVTVHGHDGDHYAFHVTNPMMNLWRHHRSYGGGHIKIVNQSSTVAFDGFPINYGNMVLEGGYGVLMLEGTAHGIDLDPVAGFLNFITWNRQQVWARGVDTDAFFGTTGPSSPQLMLNANKANVRSMSFIQPDFESNCTDVDAEFPTRGCFIDPAGGVSGNSDAFAIFRPSAYNFGDRSQSRALMWNLDMRIVDRTGTTEQWGWYDETTQKYILSVDTGPQVGASYVLKGATGSRPASPVEGAMFYDTTIHKLIVWDGSNWKAPTLATV